MSLQSIDLSVNPADETIRLGPLDGAVPRHRRELGRHGRGL